jgi:hypothetical protein
MRISWSASARAATVETASRSQSQTLFRKPSRVAALVATVLVATALVVVVGVLIVAPLCPVCMLCNSSIG